MKPPRPAELARARELAEIAIVDAALRVLGDVLVIEHPMLEEPVVEPRFATPSLYAARAVAQQARALRDALRRYRAEVLDPADDLALPF